MRSFRTAAVTLSSHAFVASQKNGVLSASASATRRCATTASLSAAAEGDDELRGGVDGEKLGGEVDSRTAPIGSAKKKGGIVADTAATAIDPYALARDDPEAMAAIKAQFERMLLGPMPMPNEPYKLPKKRIADGQWVEPAVKMAVGDTSQNPASSSSALVAKGPYMPPIHTPDPSEVQGPMVRYAPQTAEEEMAVMEAHLSQEDMLRRRGKLYRIHEACVNREEERRRKAADADNSSSASVSAPDVADDDNTVDDIDMLMGAGASDTAAAADASSSSSSMPPHVSSPFYAVHEEPYAEFWDTFASKKGEAKGDGKAPEWFATLCQDLFMRTVTPNAAVSPPSSSSSSSSPPLLEGGRAEGVSASSSAGAGGGSTADANADAGGVKKDEDGAIYDEDLDRIAFASEVYDPVRLASVHGMADSPIDAVDPYLWLPFNLRSEADYLVGRYSFPSEATYTTEAKLKLSIGGLDTEYVCFCDTYAFPDRKQLPTSVGTVPSRLWVKPSDETPVVYLQLGEHVPPAMWLPIRPTAVAVRRVLAEFALVSTQHRDAHHEQFEERLQRAEIILRNNQMPRDNGALLRYAAHEAKDVHFNFTPTREYPNFQEFFLGEYDDPRELVAYLQSSPFLFAIPHMQQEVDVHADDMAPRVDGPGIGTGLYRTLYSKSSLMLKIHLATEVKLPPQDIEGFEMLWRDVEGAVVPKSRIPVFARVMWPDHQRMAGGGKLLQRFNKLFGTEFSHTMPIDAALSIYYVMEWCKQMPNFLGIRGMRRRLDDLLEASQHADQQKKLLYPGTSDVPNPQYTNDELIGMHIQYLAHLGDTEAKRAIEALWPVGSAPVRMGCAKAALEIGDRELFREIVSSEPTGRMQRYMTHLVVKRKTRDLTAKVPKLMEDQYEFGAPLWVKGTRIDTSSLEGSIDVNRMANTHRIGKLNNTK